MKTLGKTVAAVLAMGVLVAALSACEKPEGPAERAGKEVDHAMDRAGQQLEKAGQNVQDASKGDKK